MALLDILVYPDPRLRQKAKPVMEFNEELEKLVNSSEDGVAFSLYPVSIEQLIAISDADEIMAPKSTWFEPKLRSGLFIYTID